MHSVIKFHRGLLKLPMAVKLWMMALVAANMVAPLFFLDRRESLIILGAMFAGVILMSILTGIFGFTRIIGVGHFVWFPLLYLIGGWVTELPDGDPFKTYLLVLACLNGLSLVIDAIDAIRYAMGDRTELVEGL